LNVSGIVLWGHLWPFFTTVRGPPLDFTQPVIAPLEATNEVVAA
jgi:hypothetical protein